MRLKAAQLKGCITKSPKSKRSQSHLSLETFKFLGGLGETRTRDQRIKSPLL
jgi:hypothetical protein